MKLLIGYGDPNKLFHLKEFATALSKLGVECKLVSRHDYVVGFPTKKIKRWLESGKKFKNIIKEFSPDAVFVDAQDQFGLEVIKANIPLFVYLRGHVWQEYKWARETIYKDLVMGTVLDQRHKIANEVFEKCDGVFMTADYLDGVIKEHHPNTKTFHFLEGMDASRWYPSKGMSLKHPCVGLVQHAYWWGKTKEMLILKKVIKSLPNVHFYWIGFGQYQERVLQELTPFDNFHWLGKFPWEEYPENIRKFLTEIDIYALVTGMDTTPLSCREAMSMEKPIVASNVGGIPEMIYDGKTGFLVDEGNAEQWIDKISFLLKNENTAKEMGKAARQLIIEKFNWDILAKSFLTSVTPIIRQKASPNS